MQGLERISRKRDTTLLPRRDIKGVPPWVSESYHYKQSEQESFEDSSERKKRGGLSESTSFDSLNEYELDKSLNGAFHSSEEKAGEQPKSWLKTTPKGSPEHKAYIKSTEIYRKIKEEAICHFKEQEIFLSESCKLADLMERKLIERDGQVSPEKQKILKEYKQKKLQSLEKLQREKEEYQSFVERHFPKLLASYQAERLVKLQAFYEFITATTQFLYNSNIKLGQGIENLVKDLIKCLIEGKM